VLAQRIAQFGEHRAEFLVFFYGKELRGQAANFIFHTAHGANLHQDDTVAQVQAT
jgi:hypothetical protein